MCTCEEKDSQERSAASLGSAEGIIGEDEFSDENPPSDNSCEDALLSDVQESDFRTATGESGRSANPANRQSDQDAFLDADSVGSETEDARYSECLAGIMSRLGGIEASLGTLQESFDRRIARTEHDMQVFKNLSSEVQSYREDLYLKLTLPILENIVYLQESISSTIASCHENQEEIVSLSTLEIFCSYIDDLLENNNVSKHTPAVGDKFSSSNAKLVGKVPTGDQRLGSTIAQVQGNSYFLSDRALSKAYVTVYTFDKSLTNSSLDGEGSMNAQVASSGDDSPNSGVSGGTIEAQSDPQASSDA